MMLRRGLLLAVLPLALALPLAASAQPVHIRGSATYRERMALPPGAVLEMVLEDISRADAPGSVLAEARIPITRAVPIPFILAVDQSWIDPRARHALRATITVNGRVLFRTVRPYPVRPGQAEALEMLLVRDSGAATALPRFAGTHWIATAIRGAVPAPGIVSDLTFDTDGSVHGTAGCNRIRGSWTAEGGDGLRLGRVASTMMACGGGRDAQERRFLDALGAVRHWRSEAEDLLLTDEAGLVLLRLRRE